MIKLLLWLILICIAVAFIVEYWVWILLALVVLGGAYAFCIKKGYIKSKSATPTTADIATEQNPTKARTDVQQPSDYYVVFDIETTGLSRKDDRIIEIAANKYDKDHLIEQFHRYINPGRPIPPFITQLTGVTNDDVKDAPSIQDVKAEFLSFIGNCPLVGHNIKTFDIPFLTAQLNHSFTNELIDTLYLSKKVFPGLPSYKLTYLDQALQLGALEHHRAGNDIVMTNALYLACKKPAKYRKHLADKERLASIPVEPKKARYKDIDIHSIAPTNPFATPNTPLAGKNVVFSGDFSLSLRQMMQIAVDAGATLKSSVSRKVDYLIVGAQDERFADEIGMTGKSRTAARLIEAGEADIKIISEKEFFQLLNQQLIPQ